MKVMKEFQITELSAVDNPAQQGARMAIMKRASMDIDEAKKQLEAAIKLHAAHMSGDEPTTGADGEKSQKKLMDQIEAAYRALGSGAMKRAEPAPDPFAASIAKMYSEGEEGAKTFSELLAEGESRRRYWEACEELWPVIDALRESIHSTIADTKISADAKRVLIETSVSEFLNVIREKAPEVEAELSKLLSAGSPGIPLKGQIMSDLEKKVGELETQNADLTKNLATVTAERDAAVTKAAGLEKAAEIAKSDEVLKVGDAEVRKSQTDAGVFAMLKAQQEQISKANEAAELATLEKRASEEFSHVVGTAAEKATVLKAVAGMSEDVRKSFDAIIKSAEALAKGAFETIGVRKGAVEGSAEDELNKKADEYAKANNVTFPVAYDAVLQKNAALYERTKAERAN